MRFSKNRAASSEMFSAPATRPTQPSKSSPVHRLRLMIRWQLFHIRRRRHGVSAHFIPRAPPSKRKALDQSLPFSDCCLALPGLPFAAMNVLVTGGAGYIGSTCVEHLLDQAHSVTVFDN